MFSFLTRKTNIINDNNKDKPLVAHLKQTLSRTSIALTSGFSSLVAGKKTIDDTLLEALETRLLTADLGVDATQSIIVDLTRQISRKQLGDADMLFSALRKQMIAMLAPSCKPLMIPADRRPYIILMVGINGVGKTTTVGKLARQFQKQGKLVMLAAGDTFRAAAVDQLRVWGQRNDITVIAQTDGADSASVIFDALAAAKARNIDVLIADTAGRLHTQANLMEELKKIKRVMGKLDSNAPDEIMLVVDAGTGQNALAQTLQFNEAVGISGITLTKLDGTAKGGIIFAIANKTALPIRYISIGEGIDDLRPFDSEAFVDALLYYESDA